MNCTACGYQETSKGCETPGCLRSIWMTDDVRAAREREAAEQAEREHIWAIRNRCMGGKQ